MAQGIKKKKKNLDITVIIALQTRETESQTSILKVYTQVYSKWRQMHYPKKMEQ